VRWVFGVLLLALAAASPAGAETRPLVVGVEELGYLPAYGWRNSEFVGAAREILDGFGAAKGYQMVYRPLPVKRLYAELLGGLVDLKFPDSPDWAAAIKGGYRIAYSQPIIAYVDGVMVRPENKGRGTAAVKSLGTVAGFTPLAWLDRIESGVVTLRETTQLEQTLSQVLLRRTDGAYISVAAAAHSLDVDLHQPGALVFDATLPHNRGEYRLSTVRNREVVAEFNTWLDANAALVKAINAHTGAEAVVGAGP
jgi:polar amino acid transport system substrate-binding protein